MGDTSIEWTDAVWNPSVGCSPVSAGCERCFAARMAHRLGRIEKTRAIYEGLTVVGEHGPRWNGKIHCLPKRLDQPLHWRKPRRIFVDSMGDLFHETVPDNFIAEVFGVMAVAGAGDDDPGNKPFGGIWRDNILIHRYGPHTFQILTKREKRMRSMLLDRGFREKVASAAYRWAHNRRDAGYLADCISWKHSNAAPGRAGRSWPLSNVDLGVSVEDQPTADERIPDLLLTPAAVRIVSAEPLLGPVKFGQRLIGEQQARGFNVPPHIAGVIIGGESGPSARPCKVEWIRSIVEQCRAAGVPVFVKQDSGPRPGMQGRIPDELWIKELPGAK